MPEVKIFFNVATYIPYKYMCEFYLVKGFFQKMLFFQNVGASACLWWCFITILPFQCKLLTDWKYVVKAVKLGKDCSTYYFT
jgi:hypothetical protein